MTLIVCLAFSLCGCLYIPPQITSDIDPSDFSSVQVGVTTREEVIKLIDAPIIVNDAEYLLLGGQHNAGGIAYIIPGVPTSGFGYYEFEQNQTVYFLATFDEAQILKSVEIEDQQKWTRETDVWETFISSDQDEELISIALSPDEKWLAVGSNDSDVYIWNLDTHQKVKHLEGVCGWWSGLCQVHQLAFSPDGSKLAAAGFDQLAKIWSTSTWKELASITAHYEATAATSSDTSAIAFSPDSMSLATAGNDGLIRIWDIESDTEICTLVGHKGRVLDLVYAFEGQYLVSAGIDGSVRFWSPAERSESYRVNRGAPIYSIDWSEESHQLAVASAIHAEVWSLKLIPTSEPTQVSQLQNQKKKLAHNIDQLFLFPIPDHRILHGSTVTLSPRNDLLVGISSRTMIWDTKTSDLVGSSHFDASDVVFSHDGEKIYAPKEGDVLQLDFSPTLIRSLDPRS
jgi:WD40 repeat protein